MFEEDIQKYEIVFKDLHERIQKDFVEGSKLDISKVLLLSDFRLNDRERRIFEENFENLYDWHDRLYSLAIKYAYPVSWVGTVAAGVVVGNALMIGASLFTSDPYTLNNVYWTGVFAGAAIERIYIPLSGFIMRRLTKHSVNNFANELQDIIENTRMELGYTPDQLDKYS